jgi:hypothetical protein
VVHDRALRTLWALAAGAFLLALVDFFLWLESNAADCASSCSFGQDLAGLGLVLLPAVALLLLLAGVVRWVLLRAR